MRSATGANCFVYCVVASHECWIGLGCGEFGGQVHAFGRSVMFLESLLNSFCVLGGQTSGGEPTVEYSAALKGNIRSPLILILRSGMFPSGTVHFTKLILTMSSMLYSICVCWMYVVCCRSYFTFFPLTASVYWKKSKYIKISTWHDR